MFIVTEYAALKYPLINLIVLVPLICFRPSINRDLAAIYLRVHQDKSAQMCSILHEPTTMVRDGENQDCSLTVDVGMNFRSVVDLQTSSCSERHEHSRKRSIHLFLDQLNRIIMPF